MSFKTPKQILVDLANRSQRVPGTWTVDHIEFTEPAPFAGNRNTVIGLSPTPASPVQFTPAHSFYDRVGISSKFTGTLAWEDAPIDATPEQVLAEIESRYPIKVAGTEDQLPLDITHFNVLGEVGGSAYVFTAKPESLLYIGQFAVRLGVTEVPVEPEPEPEPGHDLRMIIDPPNYSRGIILPSFHAAGYMLAHPNAPVRQTAMGFNGELQIAGTVFDEDREKIYTPSDVNVFSVPFDEIATHWNWGLHIALADTTNGTRIDELYDISVTLANVETGQSADYTFRYLTEEENYGYVGYAIVNNEDNSPYVNFGFDEEHVSGRYAQMVLPAPTMRHVIPTDKAIDGVPFGRYYVEVIAQRKEGDVAPMVVSWMADIGRPIDDTSVLFEEPVYGADPVKESFLKPDGRLLVGSGNPATDLVTADNGEIQMFGGARYYRDVNTIAPTADNVYNLNIGEARDWNFPFQVGLYDTRNAATLTDLYDVTLEIAHTDRPESLTFVLNRRDGAYFLENEEHSLSIVDGITDADGSFYQEIQRLTFYTQAIYAGVEDAPLNDAGAPYGQFQISLTAARKSGNVDPLVLSWTVNVTAPEPEPEPEPTDDTSILFEEPVIGTDPIKETFLKPDGKLLTGSGSPATDLVTADNGEVQMFGGVRYYRDPVTFAPDADNRYSLDISTNRDWNFPFQIGLYDTRNATTLTDLYDVTFTIQDASQPEASLNFVLNRRDGAYFLEDDTHSLSIVDGYTDADGAVYQEIQRLTFYVAEMYGENAPVNNAGAPFGEFLFTLTATRKTGGVEPMVLTWSAVVEGGITGPVPPPPEETPTDPEEGGSEMPTDPEEVVPPTEGGDVVTDPETTEPPVEGGDESTDPETTEPPAEGDNSEVPPPTDPEEVPEDMWKDDEPTGST